MRTRDKLITFWANPKEREKLTALSAVKGINRSALIRRLVHQEFLREIGNLKNGIV